MRMLWYAAPYVFSPPQRGADFVTTHRVLAMDQLSRAAVAIIGVPIVDATMISQSQWESSHDGVHYFKGSNDMWNGHMATMVAQAALNAIFPTCS
jgi:hypothetical protein